MKVLWLDCSLGIIQFTTEGGKWVFGDGGSSEMEPVLEGAGPMLGYSWAHRRSWVGKPLLTWPSRQPLPLLPVSKAPQMGHRARRGGTRMGVSAVVSPCFVVWAVSSLPWASVSWSFSPHFAQLRLLVRPQLPTRHQRRFSAGATPSCSDLVQGWACKLGIYQHGRTSQLAQW